MSDLQGTGIDATADITKLLSLLRAGCSVAESCTTSNVQRSNFYRWLDEADAVHASTPPEEQTAYHAKLLRFQSAVEVAASQNLTALELRLHQRAMDDGNVPAILALLKKRESGSWCGNQKVELTGSGGGPVVVTAVPAQPDMTDMNEAKAIWQARAEMGDAQAIKLLAALDDD